MILSLYPERIQQSEEETSEHSSNSKDHQPNGFKKSEPGHQRENGDKGSKPTAEGGSGGVGQEKERLVYDQQLKTQHQVSHGLKWDHESHS